MLKSFLKFVFLGGLILNLVSTSFSTTTIDAGSAWDYELNKDTSSIGHFTKKSNYPDDKNPDLACLIFGNQACHTNCYLIAQIYGYGAQGTCDKNQYCHCLIQGIHSIFTRWEKNFKSDFVLDKIVNGLLFHQAQNIMAFPLKTAEQYKQLLKSIISPYQFSKLETRDDTMASKFTRFGKVDTTAVKKYVHDSLQKTWATLDRPYLHVDYKQKLSEALKNVAGDEGSFFNLCYRIYQMQNTTLDNILNEFSRKNGISKPNIELEKDLDYTVHRAIINEIIAQNDEIRAKEISSEDVKKALTTSANPPTIANRNFPYSRTNSFGNNRFNRNYSTTRTENPTVSGGNSTASARNPTPPWASMGYGSRFDSSRFFPPGRRSLTGI